MSTARIPHKFRTDTHANGMQSIGHESFDPDNPVHLQFVAARRPSKVTVEWDDAEGKATKVYTVDHWLTVNT